MNSNQVVLGNQQKSQSTACVWAKVHGRKHVSHSNGLLDLMTKMCILLECNKEKMASHVHVCSTES